MKNKPVLILDRHRGIYFGYLVEELEGGNAVRLENARHCYYYSTVKNHKGTYGLATHGPGKESKIGPRVNMKVRDVAKIIDVSTKAMEQWEKATWL
jgi:hypothetical protein